MHSASSSTEDWSYTFIPLPAIYDVFLITKALLAFAFKKVREMLRIRCISDCFRLQNPTKITANEMQLFLNIPIFTEALRVSGGFSSHHQEHKTIHATSGIVNQHCCQLLPWRRWNCKFYLLHGSCKFRLLHGSC
jgi:hypothetical protein